MAKGRHHCTLEVSWASPAFFIPKPDGGLRLVVDYRRLNSVTVPDPYPLPTAESLFSRLHNACIFSKFDAHSGFHQMKMSKKSIPYTAFVVPFGCYAYTRMSMGLRNAPSSFQSGMNEMTEGLDFVLVYLDDVNGYSKQVPGKTSDDLWEDHLNKLEKNFIRCQSTNLKLKGSKCQIGATDIGFLGHHLSKNGLRPDPAKVDSLTTIEPPTTITELKAFLGLIGYYRSFVPRFSDLSINLNKLLSKKTEFIWTNIHQDEFDYLKRVLSEHALRVFPDFAKPFHLHTDCSNEALGSVLCQIDDTEHEVPIEFYSRSLSGSELNYTITEKECLAMVASIKHFHPYLGGGAQFIVYTDHKALISL